MDVRILYELKSEIERIYISGIRLAHHSSHILKYLLIIEKYVDEDSAYNELASALKKLIKPGEKEYVQLFSIIHTSLSYLLRLHTKTIVSDKKKKELIPKFCLNKVVSQYSYLRLKPLIDALTNANTNNRLDIIRQGNAESIFDDFRLYPYLNKALEDKDTEVVECVREIIKERDVPPLL